MNVDIVEYLGKFDNAIFVKLLISSEDKFWDAIFYYKENLITLTVDKDLEKELDCKIEEWESYSDLVYLIIDKLPPYETLLNQVDKLNLNLYK